MDQTVLKNNEEIKKLRKDVRSLSQSIEMLRQSIDGVHQTVTGGLQKVLSEIENLKMENIKIKTKLKYMANTRSGYSTDPYFCSDTEMRTKSWMTSTPNISSLRYPPGNQPFHTTSLRSQHHSIKTPDLSSDDTDDDRATIVTDSVEEDSAPRLKKEKRRTNHPLSPRLDKQNILTSELSSSSSDGKNSFPKTMSNRQNKPVTERQNMNVGSHASGSHGSVKSGSHGSGSAYKPSYDIETDRNVEPVPDTVSNIPHQNTLAKSNIVHENEPSKSNIPHQNDPTKSNIPHQNDPRKSNIPDQNTKSNISVQNGAAKSNISVQNGAAKSNVSVQNEAAKSNVSVQNGAAKSNISVQNGAANSNIPPQDSTDNLIDPGEESEEDTDIAMTVKTKVSVTYPHTVPNYKPIFVPYDQIDFSNGVEYLKSLGFITSDPNIKEFIYRLCALDNRKNEQLPKGLYTLLLLDTTYSTGPGGLLEMRKFVHDFLDEIERSTEYDLEEMVGVMEFGSHAGVLHEFTNDYSLIRDCLDKIDVCGGRTHLWSCLIGVLAYCHKRAKKCVINGRTHGVRVVFVSDGNVTDEINVLSNCENEADLERIEDRILKFMPYLLREKMSFTSVEIGMDSEARFMKLFAKKGKGMYGLALWAPFIGRYYHYQTIVGKMLPELKDPRNQGKIKDIIMKHTAEFDYFDKTDIAEISALLRDRYRFTVPEELDERKPLPEYDDDQRVTLYTTESFSRLPPIGSRIEKAPKFKDRHREYFTGTVVAHCRSNTMVVKWDETPVKIHFYKYETENHEVELIGFETKDYKEQIFREIDMTVPGLIESGCRVTRGIDWDRGDEDGGPGKMGIVLLKHAQKWVTVKWPNGKRLRHRFGAEGKYDLEIVDEKKRREQGVRETVEQYQLVDDSPRKLRTLDEEASHTIINKIDNGNHGPFVVMHNGKGYSLDLRKMKYELCGNDTRTGDIIIVYITRQERDTLRDEEREIYRKEKIDAQRAQATGAGGMDFLAQLQQGGGRGGMNLLNQMAQGGGGGLAGLLRQGGMGGGGGMPNMGQGGMPNMGQGGMPNMGQGGMPNMGQMFGQPNQGNGGNGGGGNGGYGGGGNGGYGGGVKWNCSTCTYENKPQARKCEMCKNSRS